MTIDIPQYLFVLGISLSVNVAFGIFILNSNRERKRIHKMLHDVNISIKEKNDALLYQSAKLTEAYENLWKVNQRLETEVLLRTEQIRQQHAKLVEYTQFNSHKLRGPLARLIGLSFLAQKEEMGAGLKELLDLIQKSAQELDAILRDLAKQLDEGV